jgi:allantoinase
MTTAPVTGSATADAAPPTNPGPSYDLVLRAARAITPEGELAVEVGVVDGRIAAVVPLGADLAGAEVHELAADEVLLPGLVDTHVHVNEPGRTEWEGFATATRAAAAGGVTTIVDMPLNSLPPTTSAANLAVKRERAASQAFVDVGFWGGAVPGNTADLRALHDAGVFGFKCFLADSGVPEHVYNQVRNYFDEKQYVQLIMAINTINCWNRLAISTGMFPGCLD